MTDTSITYKNFLESFIGTRLTELKDQEVETSELVNLVTKPLRTSTEGYLFPCEEDAVRFITSFNNEVTVAIKEMESLDNPIDPEVQPRLFVDFMVDIDSSELLLKSGTVIELISNNDTIIINDDVISLILDELED